jgi:hypothetical protein
MADSNGSSGEFYDGGLIMIILSDPLIESDSYKGYPQVEKSETRENLKVLYNIIRNSYILGTTELAFNNPRGAVKEQIDHFIHALR